MGNLRVMSFNIRYNNHADKGNNWKYRKEAVAGIIRNNRVDIAGLQEVLHDQLEDLKQLLPEYGWLGIGREDGIQKGEYAAIFYLKDRYTVLESSSFWLSETPEKPSMGWDAACIRIVTWAKFKDNETGEEFYHFNTHFDHEGKTAQAKSAKLLIERLKKIEQPIILSGDFNTTPDSETYEYLTGSILQDSMNITQNPHQGIMGTYQDFIIDLPEEDVLRIDYIFVNSKIDVINHKTITDTYSGKLISDHYPVIAVIKIAEVIKKNHFCLE